MLEYTEKLTLTPAMITEDDINALRATGWDDTDVLDIVMACAYFNFRVRVVDGLGLDIPDTSATNAARAREHAAELAAEKGVSSPPTSGASRNRPKPQAPAASVPVSSFPLPPRHSCEGRNPEGRGAGAVRPEGKTGVRSYSVPPFLSAPQRCYNHVHHRRA